MSHRSSRSNPSLTFPVILITQQSLHVAIPLKAVKKLLTLLWRHVS